MNSADEMASAKVQPGWNPENVPKAVLPADQFPSFNAHEAVKRGVEKNFLINTWGGLGDQICAEPAIRFGLKNFKGKSFSLASRCPTLFEHLPFEAVFDTREEEPDWSKFLTFQSIHPPDHIIWDFFSQMLVHAVDFPSISMWRSQLPVTDREIVLPDFPISSQVGDALHDGDEGYRTIVVHAGRHWPSKTFPKEWWNEVISCLRLARFRVVLIGHEVDAETGFVNVSPTDCIDLRNRLSIREFIAILKNARFVLSNDSAPIHAAASGDAFICFVASVKHPDLITHWRNGVFGYKMRNLGLDGPWNHLDYSPAQPEGLELRVLPTGLMERVLPRPVEVAQYFQAIRNGSI